MIRFIASGVFVILSCAIVQAAPTTQPTSQPASSPATQSTGAILPVNPWQPPSGTSTKPARVSFETGETIIRRTITAIEVIGRDVSSAAKAKKIEELMAAGNKQNENTEVSFTFTLADVTVGGKQSIRTGGRGGRGAATPTAGNSDLHADSDGQYTITFENADMCGSIWTITGTAKNLSSSDLEAMKTGRIAHVTGKMTGQYPLGWKTRQLNSRQESEALKAIEVKNRKALEFIVNGKCTVLDKTITIDELTVTEAWPTPNRPNPPRQVMRVGVQ